MPYGKIIPNLQINGQPAPYPVVNDREIRGAAGIMLLIGGITFAFVFFSKNFAPMYVVVPIYWMDFLTKTLAHPKYSIFGWLAKQIVRNQAPEYVGAIQKRFAWSIGLALSSTMMVFAIGLGVRGVLPFSICSLCLFFMWLESSFGICVGCQIYSWLLAKKVIRSPEIRPACPGGVCSVERG